MATIRGINNWMVSGDAIGLRMQNTLDFESVTSDDDGLFLRVNGEGLTYGYRAVNQDIEWVETNTNDIELPDTEVFIIELTVDHDISSANGSYVFNCKINNGSSTRDDNVTLVLRDGGGNALGSKMITIDKGDTGYPVTFYGGFNQDWPSGTIFKVYGYSNQDSKVMGTLTPTGLKVIEAQAAPVTSMATGEKTLIFDDGIGRRPARQDIESALMVSQQAELVKQNFTVLGTNESQTRYWQVFFDHNHDTFFTHELYKAV